MNALEWALQKAALWNEVKDNLGKVETVFQVGKQQRLCIARRCRKTEVLLLDEPTSGVGPYFNGSY